MKKPKIISYGQDRWEVKIYTLRRADGPASYQCCWYDLGMRQTKTFGRVEDARAFAHQKSVDLRNGQPSADPIAFAEIEIFRSCEKRAQQFGMSGAAAIDEWSHARTKLGGRSLADAVDFFLRFGKDVRPCTVAQAILELKEAKKLQGISKVHMFYLNRSLRRFEKALGTKVMSEVSTADIDRFLASIEGVTVRFTIRRHIRILFRWARDRGYLPDRKTAAECSQRITPPERAPGILTPDEISALLAASSPAIQPFVALGAFAGIRCAEIMRLDWQNVLWDRGYLEVAAEKAKTRSRRLIPILPNLAAWLEPWKNAEGRICKLSKYGPSLLHASRKAGIKWKQNALRHSFASYRLAIVKDAAKVSLEMGNSPAMVFRHYRELVTEDSAERWFATLPVRN